MRPLALLAFSVLLLPACKKGGFGPDFEGEISLDTTRPGSPASHMLVKTKSDKLRFEAAAPDGKTTTALFDPQTNEVSVVMDAQKAYMTLSFAEAPTAKGGAEPAKSSAEKTGKHETVAGLDCEMWVAKDPSGKKSEVCFAEGLAFFDLESVKSGGGAAWNKELRAKKLFPLRTVELDPAGKETSRTEVTKVEKKKLDDALFSVPKGYTKIAAAVPAHS